MQTLPRSPNEYYLRFLISASEEFLHHPAKALPRVTLDSTEIVKALYRLDLDPISPEYIQFVCDTMLPRPVPYTPQDPQHAGTRTYLKQQRIYDLWHPTPSVREAYLILQEPYLREKLEPLLLSSLSHTLIARKLRKHTAIALTPGGIDAFGHYFWNRRLLSQPQWVGYLQERPYVNTYVQGLTIAPDIAQQQLPYIVGISGPSQAFNSADAAARIGQIAFKHALELERKTASVDTTMSLKNCMATIEKADVIMRRSDVALRDVLRQFQKFRMKVDDARVIDVNKLTDGNYSKSGEGTDTADDEDF